ncbi:MAG: hypothetical protein F4046_02670 [Acidimicrobiaceae bacterium]|nr:hypothetical protein [Acidimicrobiaceae bacterium]
MVTEGMFDGGDRLSVETLGALCELDQSERGGSFGIEIGEFADLSDGRRAFWKEDRGWSGSGMHSQWPISSGRDLTYEAMMVTDTDEHRQDSYVEWALQRLRDMELDIDPVSVYCAPFRVEFGPGLAAEMVRVAQLFDPPERPTDRVSPSDATATHSADRAVPIDLYDEAVRVAWPAPTRATDRGDSNDLDEDQAGLQVKMPRAVIERLVAFCHDLQVTPSAVVQRLVEEYLKDSRAS